MDLSTKDVSVDSAYLIPELHLRSGTAGTKSSLHAPKMAVVGQQGHLCFLVQTICKQYTTQNPSLQVAGVKLSLPQGVWALLFLRCGQHTFG